MNLPNNRSKYLLIFDDSCEEILNSKQFVKKNCHCWETQGTENNGHHNLFHQSKLGRDVELQNTHIVLFKSPRDVLQINTLSQQLRLGSQLKDATSVPSGHLLLDLTPKIVDSLSFCFNSVSVPTKCYLPARIEAKFMNYEYTIRLYSPNISKFFPKVPKTIRSQLSKRFHSVSEQVFSKPIKRRASRSSEGRRIKISKRNFKKTKQKRTPLHKRNVILSSSKGLQLISIITLLSLND